MTVEECVARIRAEASAAGLTPAEYADRFNRITPDEVRTVMESIPTEALEWAVKFEALSHPGKLD